MLGWNSTDRAYALRFAKVPTTPYCSSCYPGPLDSFVLLIWYLKPFEFTTSAPEANDDPWRQRTEALVPAVLEGEPRQAANVIISCEARQGQKIIISNLRLMKLRLRSYYSKVVQPGDWAGFEPRAQVLSSLKSSESFCVGNPSGSLEKPMYLFSELCLNILK